MFQKRRAYSMLGLICLVILSTAIYLNWERTIKDKEEFQMRTVIQDQSRKSSGSSSLGNALTKRKLRRDVKEMGQIVRRSLRRQHDNNTDINVKDVESLRETLEEVEERQEALAVQLSTDLESHQQWQDQEAKDLSELVQSRLYNLQNPSNCSAARILVCDFDFLGCGYGCQVHNAVYCLMMAYGTNRMLVIRQKFWSFLKDLFLPFSDTCQNVKLSNVVLWPGTKEARAVRPHIRQPWMEPYPEFLPPSIPTDLAERIVQLHGHPIVWWVGQLIKYVLRPQPELTTRLRTAEVSLGFQHPVVGIHIRRTDKLWGEAKFHDVSEYMKHAENFYEGRPEVSVKRVYLATDDLLVHGECRRRYPNYTFIGDTTFAKNAQKSTRNHIESVLEMITDIHMLSRSDHLVCTFSSNVCRLACEMMQQLHPDASDKCVSLDSVWYFHGNFNSHQVVVVEHQARKEGEIELRVGDIVRVGGDNLNGYFSGTNERTGETGLYPGYKTRDVVKVVDFP